MSGYDCPCKTCVYYTNGKQHPNPNAFDEHYCEKKQKAIVRHKGNSFHFAGQWILPCDYHLYIERRCSSDQ